MPTAARSCAGRHVPQWQTVLPPRRAAVIMLLAEERDRSGDCVFAFGGCVFNTPDRFRDRKSRHARCAQGCGQGLKTTSRR